MIQRKLSNTKFRGSSYLTSSKNFRSVSLKIQSHQHIFFCYRPPCQSLKKGSLISKFDQSFTQYSTNLYSKGSTRTIWPQCPRAISFSLNRFSNQSRCSFNHYIKKKNDITIQNPKQVRLFCAHKSNSKIKSQAKFSEELREKNSRLALYGLSIVIAVIGISYASVPLYKVFCQATGFGGTTKRVESLEKLMEYQRAEEKENNEENDSTTSSKWKKKDRSDEKIKKRMITVSFNADVSDTLPWKFWPTQKEVAVIPGETALAFFTVKNKTEKAITGIATYNVTPLKAGEYFNKIQCFCFDEQRVKAREQIDMPVFFFIDPEFLADPSMDNVHDITLSYTFFNTGEEEVEEQFEKAKAEGTLPLHHKAR